MKFVDYVLKPYPKNVALFTRAWIEIKREKGKTDMPRVALFTRAWIEMGFAILSSEPISVALFTRAWIEI